MKKYPITTTLTLLSIGTLILCLFSWAKFGSDIEVGFFTILTLIFSAIGIGILSKWRNEDRAKEEQEEEEKKKLEELRQEKKELDRMAEERKSEDLAWYVSYKLSDKFSFSDDWRSSLLPNFEPELRNEILCINCEIQTKKQILGLIDHVYEQYGEKRPKSEWDSDKYYEDAVYSICLESMDYAFTLDNEERIRNIVFNGYVSDYSPTTGQMEQTTIMSIMASREQFEGIDVAHINPKACFKSLKGVSASRLVDIAPIIPILTFDEDDERFIEGRDIETDSGTNLAAMDWQDFEQLVREVLQLRFEKDGWKVNITRASRDGGVDAVIYNPDPLTGGKILVQAKRYTNTVGVSAVRDLYGAMTDERASKGILITTADFGSDSWNFVKDKPISLLNGGHLLGMMQEIGMKGYIDIQEAKEINQ